MKKSFLFLFLINVLLGYSQEELEFHDKVKELEYKIKTTEGAKKLKLLDSLCKMTIGQRAFNYDSIANVTIDYALKLDSTRLALVHSAKLVNYLYDNLGEIKLSIETFHDLEQRFAEDKNYSELGKLYFQGARPYTASGRFEEGLVYLNKAHGLALKVNDNKLKAFVKEDMGHAYAMMGDFQRARKELEETIELYLKFDPDNTSYAKRSLAILYSQNGLHEEARILRGELIDFAKKVKNNSLIYITFFDQAFDEELQGNQKERLRNLDSAEVYTEQLPDYYSKELSIAQLGAYSDNQLLPKAKQAKQKLEALLKGDKNPNFQDYNFALAKYEYALGNYTNAVVLGEKQNEMFKAVKFYEGIYMVNEFLAKVYNGLGNQKKAYEALKVHVKIKDSIKSVQKANVFSYYQTLYETEKRDAKIVKQQSEIDILDQRNKVKQQWLLFGGLGLFGLFKIVYLVRSRRFALSKQKLQEQFSQDLINGQEEERSRLARELHDSVGQKLMLLSKTTKSSGDENAEDLAKNTLEEVRSISRGLHPSNLERLGLTESINALIYSINAKTDLFFTEEIDNIDGLLPRESELHVYRIIQESLTNIIKHSEAKAVKIKVKKGVNTIKVTLSDNGKGFDFETEYKMMSLGLKTLFERAKIIGGQIDLNSSKNLGTNMSLTLSY